jgi:hypothetical protein
MHIFTRPGLLGWLVMVLALGAGLAGCANQELGEAQSGPPPAPLPFQTAPAAVQPPVDPTVAPTPTVFVFGPLVDEGLDLKAGPVDVPLELEIPALGVMAPVLGVGLTAANAMDSPKGPIGDPSWHAAYWYRGGGVPGDVGTATIAGHVNDPLGNPEIFAHLQDLHPGDQILIHLRLTNIKIRFTVNQVKVYSTEESADPAVLAQIFGAGPVEGTGPQPAPDGLAHLTLITCAGYIVNGEFDHHTVVYATRTR